MSIDWDKRQGSLGKHRHLASDVLNEETGSAGAAQAISLIGPFHVDWTQEAQLTGDGVELEALPDGAVVLRAWAEVGTLWDGAGSPGSSDYVFAICVGTAAGGAINATRYFQWKGYQASAVPGVAQENSGNSQGNLSVTRTTTAGQFLMAQFQNFAGPLSAGTADIYALIGTPA